MPAVFEDEFYDEHYDFQPTEEELETEDQRQEEAFQRWCLEH